MAKPRLDRLRLGRKLDRNAQTMLSRLVSLDLNDSVSPKETLRNQAERSRGLRRCSILAISIRVYLHAIAREIWSEHRHSWHWTRKKYHGQGASSQSPLLRHVGICMSHFCLPHRLSHVFCSPWSLFRVLEDTRLRDLHLAFCRIKQSAPPRKKPSLLSAISVNGGGNTELCLRNVTSFPCHSGPRIAS